MTAAEASPAPLPSLASLADELGALEKEYAIAFAPWEAKVKRMEALRGLLRAACPAQTDEEWAFVGQRFLVRLSGAGKQRSVNVAKLIRAIGARAFHKFASCTLKDLEAHCDPAVVEAVVTTALTGPRRITTEEKGT